MLRSPGDVAVVVVTMNRRGILRSTLRDLSALPEAPRIVVVDNGSTDGTVEMLRAEFPAVIVVALRRNRGAAARTVGVGVAGARYVAFCDDDCRWEPGAIARGVELLERHATVAVLNARVVVEGRTDSACERMRGARCADGLPGVPIALYMAGACIVRSEPFLRCGGYHPRFLIGAEEGLLAHDLLAAGWQLRYIDELVVHHRPALANRDPVRRRYYVLRNRLWTAWLRQRMPRPLAATWSLACIARSDPIARTALRDAVEGLPWVVRERRPVSREVQRRIDAVWSIDE